MNGRRLELVDDNAVLGTGVMLLERIVVIFCENVK